MLNRRNTLKLLAGAAPALAASHRIRDKLPP